MRQSIGCRCSLARVAGFCATQRPDVAYLALWKILCGAEIGAGIGAGIGRL